MAYQHAQRRMFVEEQVYLCLSCDTQFRLASTAELKCPKCGVKDIDIVVSADTAEDADETERRD